MLDEVYICQWVETWFLGRIAFWGNGFGEILSNLFRKWDIAKPL